MADPLPFGKKTEKAFGNHFPARDTTVLSVLEKEIAGYAPYIPFAWGETMLHGEEPRPLRGGDVLLCGECASALDVAMRFAQADLLPEWASVLALSQRAGRGQLRRVWSSPPGNIYAAIRLPGHGFFAGWNAAFLVGWMLALALREYGFEIFLKWPNDLLLCHEGAWGKAGGILLEERGGILLAGVGINVSFAPDLFEMRPEGAMRAAALRDAGRFFPMFSLWAGLVQRGQSLYTGWSIPEKDRIDLRSAEAILAWRNRGVAVLEADGGEYHGLLQGLDADGRLRIMTESGEIFLASGTIRLME